MTGTVTTIDRLSGTIGIQQTQSGTVGAAGGGAPEQQYKAPEGSLEKIHAGDRITFLYPPGLPESARIRSFSSFWLFPAIFGALGLAFTILSSVAFFYARKKPRAAQIAPPHLEG